MKKSDQTELLAMQHELTGAMASLAAACARIDAATEYLGKPMFTALIVEGVRGAIIAEQSPFCDLHHAAARTFHSMDSIANFERAGLLKRLPGGLRPLFLKKDLDALFLTGKATTETVRAGLKKWKARR